MKSIEQILAKVSGGHTEVPENWMSGTGFAPIAKGRNDAGPLWLMYHGEDEGFERDPQEYSRLPFVGNLGNQFEEYWIKRYAPKAVRVMERDVDVRQRASLEKTIALLHSGTKTLTKVALWNSDAGIYGSADVVAHTSWLYRTFPKLKPVDHKPEDDHYVVIDQKFVKHLTEKKGDLAQYSAQLRIYSYALGHITGVMPKYAYLATRDRPEDLIRVEINQKLGAPLDDELKQYKAQFLKIKLFDDRLHPARNKEVQVNPANTRDFPWHTAKDVIETELIKGRSLTVLPYVGINLAEGFNERGYHSLDDVLAAKPADLRLEEIKGIGSLRAAHLYAVLKAN